MVSQDRLEELRAKIRSSRYINKRPSHNNFPITKSVEVFDEGFTLEKFGQGMQLGLNQDSSRTKAAKNLGIDINDPTVKQGIFATQALKFGGELVVPSLVSAGLLGPLVAGAKALSLTNKLSKAVKAGNAIQKTYRASSAARIAKDAIVGATTAAGSSYAVNKGSSELAESLGSDVKEIDDKETNQEALIAGALGGVVSGAVGGLKTKDLDNLGNNKVNAALTKNLNSKATEYTKQFIRADDSAMKIIKDIAEKRSKELKPIKRQLDLIEGSLQKSEKKIHLDELPKSIRDLGDKVLSGNDGPFVGVKNTVEGSNMKTIFDDLYKTKPKTESIKTKGGFVSRPIREVKQNQLLSLRNNIKSILDGGFEKGADPAKAQLAGYLKRSGVLNDLDNGILKPYKTKLEAYDKVIEKYTPRNGSIKTLVDKFDEGVNFSSEDAIKAINTGDSNITKKLLELSKNKVISIEDVKDVAIKRNSSRKDLVPKQVYGDVDDSVITRIKSGESVDDISESFSKEYDKPLLELSGKTYPTTSDKLSSRLVDPVKTNRSLANSESSLRNIFGDGLTDKLDEEALLFNNVNRSKNSTLNKVTKGVEIDQSTAGNSILNASKPDRSLQRLLILKGLEELGPKAGTQLINSSVFNNKR